MTSIPALMAAIAAGASDPAPPEPSDQFSVDGGGDGVRWTSAEGRFSLGLMLRAQMRYSAFVEDDAASQTLQIRRARIKSSGWMFGPNVRYQLELGLSPRDMNVDAGEARFTPLLDWYFELTHLRDLTIRVGQSKLAYSFTRVQSSGDLQFVDRSPANGEFNLDRDIALDVRSYDLFGVDRLRYFAGVFMGEGRDARGPTNFEMGYFGRVEVHPLGIDDTHDVQADFARNTRPTLMLGGAYAFLDGATRDRGTRGEGFEDGGTSDNHNVTVDASLKVVGLSLLGEAFYRHARRVAPPSIPPSGLAPGRDGWGWSSQLGYLLGAQPVEFALRYGEVHPLRDSPVPRTRQPGGAFSWYVLEHAVKLQADYHVSLIDQAPLGHAIRLQFQAAL